MVPLALLSGLPVATVAAGIVYADAARRDLPAATRLRWSAGVAAASLVGFLVAFGLDGVFYRLYAAVAGTPVVVTHPRQLVTTLFVVGLAVSTAAVLAYGFGSRYGPLGTA